ncbi:MAG: hypothetical protein NW207_09835 [Cytophagales bacterium]|nr:hypothetical protein [Cytophagales bacterium]
MQKITLGAYKINLEDGFIRHIYHDDTEIIRGIYSAVRDHNWDTVPYTLNYSKNVITETHIHQIFTCRYEKDHIKFEAAYELKGSDTGQFSITMKGKARTSFQKNRVGFCILHPIEECAGNICDVTHVDGVQKQYKFPKYIDPNQPILNIKEMKWGKELGIEAHLTFEGDIFEMEDQRNWTDCSYKTYCTPLEVPFPVMLQVGDEVAQEIRLNIKVLNDVNTTSKSITGNAAKAPKIYLGIGISTHRNTLSENEISVLKNLNINHLHADLYLFQNTWQAQLTRAVTQAKLLNVKLELVLHLSPDKHHEEIKLFCSHAELLNANLIYTINIQLFRQTGMSADVSMLLIKTLRNVYSSTLIGTGSDANFAELNRDVFDYEMYDFISFSVNPQVHAFDDVTLMENAAAQAYAVETCMHLFKNKPVHVTPITLRQRYNPVAQDIYDIPVPLSDVRQNTPFCAEWTRKSIEVLARSGAASATYFETVGPRGVMDEVLFPVGEVFMKY